MAKKKSTTEEAATPKTDTAPKSRAAPWALLVVLGGLSAVWATFLWGQLLLSRAGGKPFCGMGESASCGALWDGAFASSIHDATGMPVAGWGLIYGLIATLLPLLALLRVADGGAPGAVGSAARLLALPGVLAVLTLLAVSASDGSLCTLCVVTYVLTLGYAVVAFLGAKAEGLPDLPQGLAIAAGATVGAFVLLLWPASGTPKSAAKVTSEAMKAAATANPSTGGQPTTPAPAGAPSAAQPYAQGPGTGDPTKDAELERFVSVLPPSAQAALSSSLADHLNGKQLVNPPTPRTTWGNANAPVRIVEWTDVLCGHCAAMHQTLEEIHAQVPGTFSVEPRHFPLDAACNPNMERQNPKGPISCVAAGVQICMEGDERAHELASKLFEAQRGLASVDDVYRVAEPYLPRDKLKACVDSPATKQKLMDDIALAMQLDPHGTPVVAINGKEANGFGPLLYAMIMTGGTGKHPAFAKLPLPQPDQHIH